MNMGVWGKLAKPIFAVINVSSVQEQPPAIQDHFQIYIPDNETSNVDDEEVEEHDNGIIYDDVDLSEAEVAGEGPPGPPVPALHLHTAANHHKYTHHLPRGLLMCMSDRGSCEGEYDPPGQAHLLRGRRPWEHRPGVKNIGVISNMIPLG